MAENDLSSIEKMEGELKAMNEALAARDAKIKEMAEYLRNAALNSDLSFAIAKRPRFRPEATEDALMAAEPLFSIEDGELVSVDGSHASVEAWLDSTTKSKPHWWAEDVAPERGPSPTQGGTMTRAEFMRLGTAARAEFCRSGGRVTNGGDRTAQDVGGNKVMTQSEYDRNPLAARAKFKAGWRVVPG